MKNYYSADPKFGVFDEEYIAHHKMRYVCVYGTESNN